MLAERCSDKFNKKCCQNHRRIKSGKADFKYKIGLTNIQQPFLLENHPDYKSPTTAMVYSMIIPGLGKNYNGDIGFGHGWMYVNPLLSIINNCNSNQVI